ncbi:hypothetical protein JX265_006370 [Neoarthrinium moseri]|uniref:Uncharacterized protein n=1 Tax=Neoarthrinium moseri TaxID=1658444 RepID=A0A9Q0AQZ1_9PEZI|nr:uncharacterized protein JN550_008241 [Neoarthrinium moseri]KAI1865484.1 hypothetical protein JN550_008241 [Neoarthrinium moseri]KAI1870200.1 hypothetical protein JX265_006370 [Neoarthrinium moseri]
MSSSAGNPFRPSNSVPGSALASGSQTPSSSKKKKHRGGRKHRRPRRKSFAALQEDEGDSSVQGDNPEASHSGFYMQGRNLSNTSVDSQALLDHRAHQYGPRPRRPSVLNTPYTLPSQGERGSQSRIRTMSGRDLDREDEHDRSDFDEGAPLLSGSRISESSNQRKGYGSNEGRPRFERRGSSRSSKWRSGLLPTTPSGDRYNVNYPPSMPPSPRMGASDVNFGDEMMREELSQALSQPASLMEDHDDPLQGSSPLQRRHTIAIQAEDDVCYPQEGMSEIAEEDTQRSQDQRSRRPRRRRARWPDLAMLEDWSRYEKEKNNTEDRRMKKITEPQLINGRLRQVTRSWYKSEEDAPYRFTYFNEELQSTIHSLTISELVPPDGSFRELFIPDPPILSDSSEESDDEDLLGPQVPGSIRNGRTGYGSRDPTRQPSLATTNRSSDQPDRGAGGTLSPKQTVPASATTSRNQSGDATPIGHDIKSPPPAFADLKSPSPQFQKPVRYGERPVWWLDVLSPTPDEMKIIQKTFGIHPLTSEDIMLQEQREKVELFRHYYFVSYRSFDQDEESETHLDPVNMYIVVFREGILSFHFGQTPHPANVRRRIRQLKDYIMLSSDWIGYAIIDDITDVFGPLVQNIQDDVDNIEDAILGMNSRSGSVARRQKDSNNEKEDSATVHTSAAELDGDMLHRIGQCRKKATELLRLLGNKADVIKGFAKRCNEHYEVAPRSEIGLYLGDIQDHIITMTGNLMHADKTLGVSSNTYLAQINIAMNERGEQTNDTLNKLTVLGTIVLPMNIITGLWGMNVWVPGQDFEGDLTWFWCITAGLVAFGAACYLTATRVYKIA